MYKTEWILAMAAIIWAVTSLIYQWVKARGKGRIDYSVGVGNPLQGIWYNFTWAMTPAHKESIRLHPIEFSIGIIMHIGIFAAIIKTIVHIANPSINQLMPAVFGIIPAIGALCGIILLLRRVTSANMRSISTPDDYISIILTIVFMLAAMAHEYRLIITEAFFICSAILFFYLPIGKLKHALFFFIARAEYGSRLGYRGTYPSRHQIK